VAERDDDRGAKFVRLLAACERRLDNYVLTLVPHWSDAEDVAQEVKLRLWEQFDDYDATKDFGAWACTIAYYEVLTFRTNAGRSRLQFSQEALDRVATEASHVTRQSDTRMAFLLKCMDKLTQWQRELLLRCCVAGESIKDLAAELNRKVDSTRKAVLRIRRDLLHCVEEAMHGKATDQESLNAEGLDDGAADEDAMDERAEP
jgi:RNA polymerase sigma-70 factor (ECF subfamily)